LTNFKAAENGRGSNLSNSNLSHITR